MFEESDGVVQLSELLGDDVVNVETSSPKTSDREENYFKVLESVNAYIERVVTGAIESDKLSGEGAEFDVFRRNRQTESPLASKVAVALSYLFGVSPLEELPSQHGDSYDLLHFLADSHYHVPFIVKGDSSLTGVLYHWLSTTCGVTSLSLLGKLSGTLSYTLRGEGFTSEQELVLSLLLNRLYFCKESLLTSELSPLDIFVDTHFLGTHLNWFYTDFDVPFRL